MNIKKCELLCVQVNYLETTIVLLHLLFNLLAYSSHTFIIFVFGYISCFSPFQDLDGLPCIGRGQMIS
jgi:hypothetical protein